MKEECFGFYPQNALKAFDGPGAISNEFKKAALPNVTLSISHKVDESMRQAIYGEITKWAGADYKLLVNNCGDFVFAIARVAGMRLPDRATVTLPTEFVSGLQKLYWQGSWASDDANTRFSLLIADASVEWIERNPESKQKFSKTVPTLAQKDGTVRIERPNTADVLAGLSFDAAIIPSILAASPKPSFMILTRENAGMRAEWNGLTVIKNANGSFKQLKQPGSAPAKPFLFDRLP